MAVMWGCGDGCLRFTSAGRFGGADSSGIWKDDVRRMPDSHSEAFGIGLHIVFFWKENTAGLDLEVFVL
jgi:hypothetical protein